MALRRLHSPCSRISNVLQNFYRCDHKIAAKEPKRVTSDHMTLRKHQVAGHLVCSTNCFLLSFLLIALRAVLRGIGYIHQQSNGTRAGFVTLACNLQQRARSARFPYLKVGIARWYTKQDDHGVDVQCLAKSSCMNQLYHHQKENIFKIPQQQFRV